MFDIVLLRVGLPARCCFGEGGKREAGRLALEQVREPAHLHSEASGVAELGNEADIG